MITQKDRILELLNAGDVLTQRRLRNEEGIQNPGGRILELREDGHKIVTTFVPVPTRWGDGKTEIAEYRLVRETLF